MTCTSNGTSRRSVLQALAAGTASLACPALAWATPDMVAQEVKKAFPGKTAVEGKIKLDLPSIAENGLVVPLNFEVESPMTEADHVKSVHFFAEGNPNAQLAVFHYTPLIPKVGGQIRIRLAQSQNIVAYAEMSNGSVYTAKKEVKVTIGGCGG